MKPKLKWKVGDAPTGRYRSFQERSWPSATYAGSELMAVSIFSDASYTPELAKNCERAPLTIQIADHSQIPWVWRRLKKRVNSLDEAKELAMKALLASPNFIPEQFK